MKAEISYKNIMVPWLDVFIASNPLIILNICIYIFVSPVKCVFEPSKE